MIPMAEAKKMGLIKVTKVENGLKEEKDLTKKIGVSLVGKVEKEKKEVKAGVIKDKENKDTENSKLTPKTTGAKPSTTKIVGIIGKKGEDTEDDPIAKSLEERKKAGGYTEVVGKAVGDKLKK